MAFGYYRIISQCVHLRLFPSKNGGNWHYPSWGKYLKLPECRLPVMLRFYKYLLPDRSQSALLQDFQRLWEVVLYALVKKAPSFG